MGAFGAAILGRERWEEGHVSTLINPEDLIQPHPELPPVGVSCFSRVTFERLCSALGAVRIEGTEIGNANGDVPIYRAAFAGHPFALFLSPVGAAACVGQYEDLFAAGLRAAVVFGTCGVLDRSIPDCGVILPSSAVRDEGVSYHYAAPSDEIPVNVGTLEAAKNVLNAIGVDYASGKVWTMDAVYRETRGLVEQRKAEGCIAVDMECSALAALAAFRKRTILQFFYAADNLDSETWDARSLANGLALAEKDRVAFVAMELAAKLWETEEF